MATNMATQIATKGPLGSALSQWLFLGFGTVVIFTGENGVSAAAKEIANTLLRLVSGNGSALLRDASLASQNLMPQQPIVIHNISPSTSSELSKDSGKYGTIIQLSMGAGACWAIYILGAQLLPESIKELLPVTRQFFEKSVTSLGKGIIKVRDVLSEQIAALGLKQDELAAKQECTYDAVNELKKDIGDVRINIDDIAIAISRCESSLTDASGRQTYMSRGIRLLVQCVGDLLRNSNPAVADELEQFSRLSEGIDDYDRENNSRHSPSTPLKRSNLTYPSSPKISEIGSVCGSEDVRPLNLPGPAKSLSPPPITGAGVVSPSPFGQSPGPLVGKTSLMTMRSMSSIARQGSCPENEVPASEQGLSVPLDEVDQLLASIRSGAI